MRIVELPHRRLPVALAIHEVLQAAQRVEAELVDAERFPPLGRGVADICMAASRFRGIEIDGRLAAVIEIERPAPGHTHIASLAVRPAYFRRGLASALLASVLAEPGIERVTVDTAAANAPALALYRKFGFELRRRWQTREGIPMVSLVRCD